MYMEVEIIALFNGKKIDNLKNHFTRFFAVEGTATSQHLVKSIGPSTL